MESSNGKNRIHLGLLVGTLISFCQYRIWEGVVEYAKQNDISLTAYFGTYHTSDSGFVPHYETCMESIRNNKTLDGLIISTSSVTTDMKPEYFEEYIRKIPEHLPVVSLGSPQPGIVSVVVDSVSGICTLVSHLIHSHGKKRIAFVKGPEQTWEAEERLIGYKKALADNGMQFRDEYILPGSYLEESGAAAVAELLDNRKLKVDAIVASNDAMAAGVLRELKSRGIQVPADIAVTGFDDDIISWRTTPTITTVRQDFYNLGIVSASIICDIINQKPVKHVNFLPTISVIRQSCGCFEGKQLSDETKLDTAEPEADSLISFTLRKATPLFQENIPKRKIRQWITQLINALKEDTFSKDNFQHCLFGILGDYKHYSDDKYVWCDVLHTLIIGELNYRSEMGFTKSTLSALISTITLILDTIHSEQQALEYEANEFRMAIGRAANSLVSSFDIDSLTDELGRSLPKLFIKTALICLYRSPVGNNDPGADRTLDTVLGYDDERVIYINCAGRDAALPFDYSSIEGFDFGREKRTLLFYPLFFGGDELGIAILSYDPKVPMDAYASLRINISTAVKGAALLHKIHALSVIDELTGLYNRRGFFQQAGAAMKYMSREESQQTAVVLFLDLDRLKAINDTLGHKEGDMALVAFAKILKESLRETDIIGRLGGDEFVIFSSVDSKESIKQLEQRIRGGISEYNAKKLRPYNLSTSMGNSVLNALTIQSLESAIQRADNFLYDEKKKKRG